jgi:serine phosphatase RsbU (regulator of sigma subunit)
VKHRALEIPVLLKRSARYLLVQRGFTLLLVLFSATLTLLVARWFSAYLESQMEGRQPSGVALGVGLGIVLVWVGTHVRQRVTQRIDRAFFRTAYDARQILQDLAEKTRTAVNREELAKLLEQHVQQALFPKFLTVYLEGSEGSLRAVAGRAVPGLEVIPAGHPVLVEIARRGQPWELPPLEEGGVGKLLLLGPLAADCLVPILGRDHRLIGLLLLGPRLSEEPYSGEDKRLLGSVANQAGGALESIRLAEKIAARMEADRRTAWELEIAKQVQSRLLPQKAPALETLDYAGACIQARAVGGDYYDFLELGGGQLGLLLADIAGKGISGALLMAHLQASLRSQYAVALDDLPGLLERINRQLCDSTAASHFATLFFGCYEDRTRRLRYANCGHNPPLRLGLDGSVERLVTTAPVLGLLENWETTIEETQLTPGDTLLIFSDGISEAMSDRGDEFGDERLLEALRQHAELAPPDLLAALIRTVQGFSGREQEDDMTVVVARVR